MDHNFTRTRYDLVVLDLMLPGEDGLAICRRLRAARQRTCPIIMLTAKGDDVDRIVGLEMGADDYLAKPFNPRELVARIHAVLRRQAPAPAAGRAHAREDDGGRPSGPSRSTSAPARSPGTAIPSPSRPASSPLLKVLAQHPREPLSRDKLMELARGREHESYDRSIDVQVSRLRKLLGEDPAEPALHPDGVGLRLRVRSRRDAAEMKMVGRAPSSGARSLVLVVALVALAGGVVLALPPAGAAAAAWRIGIGQFVSHLKTISAALQHDCRRAASSEFIARSPRRKASASCPARGDEPRRPAADVPGMQHVPRAHQASCFGDEADVFVRPGRRRRPASCGCRLPAGDRDFWVALPAQPRRARQHRRPALLDARRRRHRDPRHRPHRVAAQPAAHASSREAAEDLGKGGDPPPVPETGPSEVRAVARAFNHMKESLQERGARAHHVPRRHLARPAHAARAAAAGRGDARRAAWKPARRRAWSRTSRT